MLSRLHCVGCAWAGYGAAALLQSACDASEHDETTPTLLQQADAIAEAQRFNIKTPPQLDQLKIGMNNGRVNGFDGFRFAVSKQVNLNTAVSHL